MFAIRGLVALMAVSLASGFSVNSAFSGSAAAQAGGLRLRSTCRSENGAGKLQMGLFDKIMGGDDNSQQAGAPPPANFVPPKASVPDSIAQGFVPPKATVPEGLGTQADPQEAEAPPAKLPPKQIIPTEGPASTLKEPPKNYGGTPLANPDLVDTFVFDGMVEQRDYKREGKLEPGMAVMVRRSDGSTKWGEVIKKSGFLWEDIWTVAVTKNPDGTSANTRIEQGVMLCRPMPQVLAQAKAEAAALAQMDAEMEAGGNGGNPQAYV